MMCVNVVSKLIKKQWEAAFEVLDDETNAPVADALVVSGTKSGTTGADGKVTLSPFKKGTYPFTITHVDYEDFTSTFLAA